MIDKALTLTRSELRDFDGEQLADLLTDARNAFRSPEKLAKALKRGEEAVRDGLRRVIWSVLAIQAEQKRSAGRRLIEGLETAETLEQKRGREQLRVKLLNAASRSRRQRMTVRVPR